MSFQNSYGPDGSININVVPSFGRIVQLPEPQKVTTVLYFWCRFLKLKHGELEKVLLEQDQLISTQADIYHLVLDKLLRTQLITNISMNMLKDQDLAEDLVFDYLNIKIYLISSNSKTNVLKLYFISFSNIFR